MQIRHVNKTLRMTGKRGEAQECGLKVFPISCGPSFYRESPSIHNLMKSRVEESRIPASAVLYCAMDGRMRLSLEAGQRSTPRFGSWIDQTCLINELVIPG
jgi:hypothetical protein